MINVTRLSKTRTLRFKLTPTGMALDYGLGCPQNVWVTAVLLEAEEVVFTLFLHNQHGPHWRTDTDVPSLLHAFLFAVFSRI